jgi:CRP/FNR family transcriptional regulator, cyclic AMP receptor protein
VRPSPPRPRLKVPFDVNAFLHASGRARTLVEYRAKDVLYAQGDCADTLFYIKDGRVKLSVVSRTGKEAVVATPGSGDFVGEGALAGQPVRTGTATAMAATTALVIGKTEMLRALHEQPAFSDYFIAYLLSRNTRAEADLIDQLFNHTEKRLARALLLLAHYGKPNGPHRVLPKISQETLAEMIGTTRSRVNFFMRKFRKLEFLEYKGGLKINAALLTVLLHDATPAPVRIDDRFAEQAAVPPGSSGEESRGGRASFDAPSP